jgi:ABC-2 type transport system permease protein
MRFSPTYAIVLRYFYLLRGSLPRVMPLFLWVAVDIILWGFITRYLNGVAQPGMNFIPVFLGAVLLWDFFSRVMMGVTMVFFEDVWTRNFLNFFATPLTIIEYLTGLVTSSIVTSAVGLVVMIALCGVFGLSFLVYGVMLAPYLLILFAFGIALGILSSALVLRLGPSAEWFIWPIPVLISPFAGVFYPLATLPAPMRAVSTILPPSYVFENMRTILAGGAPSWGGMAAALGLDVVYVLLACAVFARTYRHAVRVGLIARYSAETVS